MEAEGPDHGQRWLTRGDSMLVDEGPEDTMGWPAVEDRMEDMIE